MTDTQQVVEGTGAMSVEELAEAQASASASLNSDVPEGMIRLFDPEHESLIYGPGRYLGDPNQQVEDNVIVFGPKAFLEPHVALVSEQHPQLDALLKAYPAIKVVEGVPRFYVCPYDEREFQTKFALRGHMTSHRKEQDAAE